MAENFTVFFDQQGAGDATAGYNWSNKAPTNNASNVGGVSVYRSVIVNAETNQEACNAVRKAYGESMVTGPMLVAKTTAFEEKTAV